jgi:hypothetical protein
VETANHYVRLLVRPRNGHTILPEVSARVRSSGIAVEEIRAERGHLDEVFRAITTGR